MIKEQKWISKRIDKFIVVNKLFGKNNLGKIFRGFVENDKEKPFLVKQIKQFHMQFMDNEIKKQAKKQRIQRVNVFRVSIIYEFKNIFNPKQFKSKNKQTFFQFLRFFSLYFTNKQILCFFIRYLKEIFFLNIDLTQYLINQEKIQLSIVVTQMKFFQNFYHFSLTSIFTLFKIDFVKIYGISSTINHVYIFEEYCNEESLWDYLRKKKMKDTDQVKQQLLKFSNILQKDSKNFKNIRLFMDVFFQNFSLYPYVAPQKLEGVRFSSNCDIWSVDIILFEMIYGKLPWMGTSQISLFLNIKQKSLIFPSEPVRSEKIKSLIKCMLQFKEDYKLFETFKQLNQVIQDNYAERIQKVYILYPNWFFKTIYALAKPFLTERTKQKVIFVDLIQDMTNYFEPSELLVEHGGTSPYKFNYQFEKKNQCNQANDLQSEYINQNSLIETADCGDNQSDYQPTIQLESQCKE